MNSPSSTTADSVLTAIVSLGSSQSLQGQSPASIVRAAMESLAQGSIAFTASSLYRSEPQDCPPGSADFINAIMLLQLPADTTASSFLARTQAVEAEFQRRRGAERNQPRTLDVDIISFGDQVLESEVLTLPHPRAMQRRFVLLPLAEVDSSIVLPGQAASIAQLLQGLPAYERVERIA